MVEPVPAPPLLSTLSPEEQETLSKLQRELPGCADYTIARFVRARDGHYDNARTMFEGYLKWREDFGVDHIASFDFPELPLVKQFYPHGYHKTDRQGRPIYIERYGELNLPELFRITTNERMIQYFVKGYEHLLESIFPACSAARGFPVEQSLVILDLGGSSLRLLSKQIYDFIQLTSRISQDFYPEILGRMFVVNTPMLFSMVWRMINPWINEKTRQKILLESSKYQQKLLELVDPDNLPEFLGGTCRCPGGCLSSNAGPWSN